MEAVQSIDDRIGDIQKDIAAKQEEIVQLRKDRPQEAVNDYTLKDRNGNDVKLSDLFEDKSELTVIHNMGKGCRYCTMWADSFRGISDMMNDRMAFVLISPDAPEVMKEFGENRDWNFNYLSAAGTSFIKDMGYEVEKDGKPAYWPGVSALVKDDSGKIQRVGKDYFGPGDTYCAPWHFFNLFPNGVNGWVPKYEY